MIARATPNKDLLSKITKVDIHQVPYPSNRLLEKDTETLALFILGLVGANSSHVIESLSTLWATMDDSVRTLAIGEAVLVLCDQSAIDNQVAGWIYSSLSELAESQLETLAESDPYTAHNGQQESALAIREWLLYAADTLGLRISDKHRAQCLFDRAHITTFALNSRIDLVSESMVTAAKALMGIGETAIAEEYCESVCRDLKHTLKLGDEILEDFAVVKQGVFWLHEACNLLDVMGNKKYRRMKESATRLLSSWEVDSFSPRVRIGPILATYMNRSELLAVFLYLLESIGTENVTALETLCFDFEILDSDMDTLNRSMDDSLFDVSADAGECTVWGLDRSQITEAIGRAKLLCQARQSPWDA